MLRKDVPKRLFRLPKSLFGRHKVSDADGDTTNAPDGDLPHTLDGAGGNATIGSL